MEISESIGKKLLKAEIYPEAENIATVTLEIATTSENILKGRVIPIRAKYRR